MRPDRDTYLMSMARVAARRSTCDRMDGVGVVISRDGRVLVTGYNGAPAGMEHCDHTGDRELPLGQGGASGGQSTPAAGGGGHGGGHGTVRGNLAAAPMFPRRYLVSGVVQDHPGCLRTLHAEVNAIAYAARYGVQLQDATMYSTHSPCLNCCQLIVNSGIVRVVYATEYRIVAGLTLLRNARIVTEHMAIDLSSEI